MVKNGWETHRPVRKPNTIAKSLAIGDPADGYFAAKVIRESGGWAEDVSDAEIAEAMALLGRTEGIFAETAGGVTVAVARKLIEQGRIGRDEEIVLCITGNGLKTQDAVADLLEQPAIIGPSLEEFEPLVEGAPRTGAGVSSFTEHFHSLSREAYGELRTALCSAATRLNRDPEPLKRVTLDGRMPSSSDSHADAAAHRRQDHGRGDGRARSGRAGRPRRQVSRPRPARLFDNGQVRRFVNLYLNDEDIRYLDNLATPVKDGDELTIIPAVAGG